MMSDGGAWCMWPSTKKCCNSSFTMTRQLWSWQCFLCSESHLTTKQCTDVWSQESNWSCLFDQVHSSVCTVLACVTKSLWAPLWVQLWTTFWTQGAVIIQSLGISWCSACLLKSGSVTPPDIILDESISLISRPSHRSVFDCLQYVRNAGERSGP